MTEFEKYATRHCGISSTTYAKYTSAINKNAMAGMVSDSLTPYIIAAPVEDVVTMALLRREGPLSTYPSTVRIPASGQVSGSPS